MRIFCKFPRFSTLCSKVAVRPKNVFLPVCSTAPNIKASSSLLAGRSWYMGLTSLGKVHKQINP